MNWCVVPKLVFFTGEISALVPVKRAGERLAHRVVVVENLVRFGTANGIADRGQVRWDIGVVAEAVGVVGVALRLARTSSICEMRALELLQVAPMPGL